MSSPLIAPPPIATPLLDKVSGRITAPWVAWFNSLQNSTGTLQTAAIPPPTAPVTAWGGASTAGVAVPLWGPTTPQIYWQ